MKKFIAGLSCGLLFSVATYAYASGDTIEAYFFKAKYLINGKEATLDDGYVTLNYNGHAYVPIRFVSEKTGMKVGYDESSQTILVSEANSKNQEVLVDNKAPDVSITNLIAMKDPNSGNTIVTGQISISDLDTANIKGNLSFYSADGTKLGEVIIDGDFKKGSQEFSTSGTGDFSSYSKVTLNIGALNYKILR